MDRIRLGLIGFGGFGRFTADIFAASPAVQITAVSETDPARCMDAVQTYGIRGYETPEELFSDEAVQAVVISSPPSTHAALAIAAATAGKHVFCEKPLATTLAGAQATIEAAQKNNVRLTVDFVLRHNPLNHRIAALLRSGVMGELHHMSLENWATDEALKPGHWFWDPQQSGGIWIEHGVHFFDLFSYFSGQSPETINAMSTTRPDGCQDRVWALAGYPSGLKATYHHAFAQPKRFEQTTIRLATVLGYITLSGWIQTEARIDALVDDVGLEKMKSILDVEPSIIEQYSGSECEGWASGKPYHVTQRAVFDLHLAQGKQAVYRESVAGAMLDFAQAISDPSRSLMVTAEEGKRTLAAAVAAVEASKSGASTPVMN